MARRRRARFWSMGPPQAGSISEIASVTVARRRRACIWSMGQPQAGLISEIAQFTVASSSIHSGRFFGNSPTYQYLSLLILILIVKVTRLLPKIGVTLHENFMATFANTIICDFWN